MCFSKQNLTLYSSALTLRGSFWTFLTLRGSFWTFLTLRGSFLAFLTLRGSFWTFQTLRGCFLTLSEFFFSCPRNLFVPKKNFFFSKSSEISHESRFQWG